MLETWRDQNTAPPYDVNRDALRQTLQTEQARVQSQLRTRRRGLWVMWIFGTGMAIWSGFWIAITITNGWPIIYAITSGLCVGLFGLAAVTSWVGRGREPEQKFGNTLQEEVRRNLGLVDFQLSITRRWILPMLGTASFLVGTGVFSWTTMRSQNISDSSGSGWFWYTALMIALGAWASYKARDEMRKAEPKLEARQRRLRELLTSLEARE
jgi:hypothetical protein